MQVCDNCGGAISRHPQKGMCSACYSWWWRHGEMRPAKRWRCSPGEQGTCENCRQGKAKVRNLCKACYHYRTRTGTDRPRRLWRETCKNCERPLVRSHSVSSVLQTHSGYCGTCYEYKRRNGEMRPQEAIQAHAPMGYCDCGYPATRTLKLSFGGVSDQAERSDVYRLCQRCYELEVSP